MKTRSVALAESVMKESVRQVNITTNHSIEKVRARDVSCILSTAIETHNNSKNT